MRSEPFWLPLNAIVAFNRHEVQRTGEPHGVRDRGLLESAWARPINLYVYEGERDLIALATALLFGIVRNHPFFQGNKRTGFLAAKTFLEVNGVALLAADGAGLAARVVWAAEGRISETEFADYLAHNVQPLDG